MENASKALIMASSILISVFIITLLVLMVHSLRDWKNVEETSQEALKLIEYHKKIENFNRAGLYGSELMSLANLIEDYNQRDLKEEGYEPITLKVTMKRISSDNNTAFSSKTNEYITFDSAKKLIEAFEELESNVTNAKNNKAKIIVQDINYNDVNTNKTVIQLEAMSENELKVYIKKNLEIIEQTNIDKVYQNIRMAIKQAYSEAKSELTQVKNKRFIEAPVVMYDKGNGRITSMAFIEV